jgi:PAT family beta-lactamase induction signal transducer AmpG
VSATAGPTSKPPHPFLYFILFLPFGGTSGFISVTIAHFAKQHGVMDGAIAALIATGTLPHTFKVLWAPVVDTLWTGKGWFMLSNLVSSLAIIAMGFVPVTSDNLGLLTAIVFVNGVATTFIGMCAEALMARLTPPEGRGAAAGWSQAGNVGGVFVGGVGMLIAKQFAEPWVTTTIIGVALLGCSSALLFVKEPPREVVRFVDSMREFGRTMKEMVANWNAARITIIAVVLSLLPIGSGGAQGMFVAMAGDWRASDELVAFANGLVTGVAAIFGSLLGGKLSDRMDRRAAYAVCGVLLALVAFGMALGPRTPWAYAVGVIAYNIGLGLCYATFTGFVLDIIGREAGATKYNVFASLANMPIFWMTRIDGQVAEQHGRTMMLWVDGLAGVAGAVVLLVIVFLMPRKKLEAAAR